MNNLKNHLIDQCRELVWAYENGELGQTEMPENSSPNFVPKNCEWSLAYFTLPMALNYQRNSYELWASALKTFADPKTKDVFDVKISARLNKNVIQEKLLKYKLALQPNKHIETWQTISSTVIENWGSIQELLTAANFDYLELKRFVQKEYKKGFPYLSGPKIFNYWCYILGEYCGIDLKNSKFIEIAPDTHITKCSVRLGVITDSEAETLSKEEISRRWREALEGSGIKPIDMHAPLWFWSRNGFIYRLKEFK